MNVLKNIDLKAFNTFGLPSVADQYIKIKSVNELCSLDLSHDLFILGGGSNILLPSRLNKLVLHNAIDFIDVTVTRDDRILIEVGAGVNWHHLVTVCVKMGWSGIENLALIPGRVGAAPVQNIGAYGVELKDVFVNLTAFDRQSNQLVTMDKESCDFDYRSSLFKHAGKGRYIITSVTLQLKKQDFKANISYYALRDVFGQMNVQKPTIQQVFDAVVQIRSSKLPDPTILGNSGSFFKNPVIDADAFDKLISKFPDLKYFKAENGKFKIPAGYLIESCGWKGRRIGNTGCYEKQALVIVNYGGATSEEVVDLVAKIKQSVVDKFDVMLQEEVNIIKSN